MRGGVTNPLMPDQAMDHLMQDDILNLLLREIEASAEGEAASFSVAGLRADPFAGMGEETE